VVICRCCKSWPGREGIGRSDLSSMPSKLFMKFQLGFWFTKSFRPLTILHFDARTCDINLVHSLGESASRSSWYDLIGQEKYTAGLTPWQNFFASKGPLFEPALRPNGFTTPLIPRYQENEIDSRAAPRCVTTWVFLWRMPSQVCWHFWPKSSQNWHNRFDEFSKVHFHQVLINHGRFVNILKSRIWMVETYLYRRSEKVELVTIRLNFFLRSRFGCNSKQECQSNRTRIETPSNMIWRTQIPGEPSKLYPGSRGNSTFLFLGTERYLGTWEMKETSVWTKSYYFGLLIHPNLASSRRLGNWSRGKSIDHNSWKPGLCLSFSWLNKNRYSSASVSNSNTIA
jgi:hypothetical protein